jgi:hypothetical protein
MNTSSSDAPASREAFDLDRVARTVVGPGCTRADLPSAPGVRAWVVDIQPGHQWPRTDQHGAGGESVFVVSGELIEGDERYGPGTYLFYGPHSRHRPRSERGVCLLGHNVMLPEESAS